MTEESITVRNEFFLFSPPFESGLLQQEKQLAPFVFVNLPENYNQVQWKTEKEEEEEENY